MYLRSRQKALFMAVCVFTSYMVVPQTPLLANEVTFIKEETKVIPSFVYTNDMPEVSDINIIYSDYTVIETEAIAEESNTISYAVQSRFSDDEISLLERVTMSECGNQSYECKIAVAQTLINRLDSGRYADNLYDIVHAANQYSTANNGEPNDDVKNAVQAAILKPYPETMVYFRESYYHPFGVPYYNWGVLYFSLYE